MKFCFHFFVDGFGGMGDAVVCTKCGLDKYPEAIPFAIRFAKLSGRYVPETHPEYKQYAEKAVAARKSREAVQLI
jgi:hypothetical protein